MNVRRLLLLVCLPALLAAQDLREIVRRSVATDQKDAEIARNYTYLQREVSTDLDNSNQPKKTEIRTFDVTLQDGSPYRRLVARNDQPLSPAEQKQEDEKLKLNIEQRRKETPEQRKRRIADFERKRQKQREPLREVPDAFDFRLVGEESLNGGETYVIDATPKPGYKPKSSEAFYLPKVKLRLWIEKKQYKWIKADVESLDTITIGGFMIRLAKGSRVGMEQTLVNNEVWLPKRITLSASLRLLLVKGLHKSLDFSFSDYKKFQTDSRIVSTEPIAK